MRCYAGEKIALFIDGSNLYAAARALGFDIDYKKLLDFFSTKGRLIRAFYYTALVEDQEYSPIRPLVDWLDYNGYSMVTKPTKEFTDAMGRRKIKGNMDIELAVDLMENGGQHRPCHFIFGRRGFPQSGRSRPAQRRARYRRVNGSISAADGRGRTAPPGRSFYGSVRSGAEYFPRTAADQRRTGFFQGSVYPVQ